MLALTAVALAKAGRLKLINWGVSVSMSVGVGVELIGNISKYTPE